VDGDTLSDVFRPTGSDLRESRLDLALALTGPVQDDGYKGSQRVKPVQFRPTTVCVLTCCFNPVQGGAIVLILSRRVNESLRINGCGIDGEIKVYVLAVSGKRVKLGIEAPDDIGVIRSELPSFTRNQSKGDV